METVAITLLFKDFGGYVYRIKIDNVRPNITAAEAAVLGNMIVSKDMISIKGNRLVSYTGAELVRSETEKLDAQ